jgi:hypothetical protein
MAGLFEDRKSGFHYKCTRAPSIPRGKESWGTPCSFLGGNPIHPQTIYWTITLASLPGISSKNSVLYCPVLSLDFIVKNNLHSRVVSNIGNIEFTVGFL